MIIDYSAARPPAAALKAAGVTAVGRYIGWDGVPGHASIGKNITRAEAAALHAAGISIFLAFEYDPQAPRLGTGQGTRDGTLAAAQLAGLGAPPGTGVYFAADWDVPDYAPALSPTPAHALAKLGPVGKYFQAIHDLRPAYQVGAYGGYWVISRLFDAGLIRLGWQTIAWSGGQRDTRAALYQTGTKAPIEGTDVDVHETTVADFGQWPRPGYHGEYVTAGMYDLGQLAVKLEVAPAALLRMTAVRYGSFGDVLARYLNGILAGNWPVTTPLPAGIRFWVD